MTLQRIRLELARTPQFPNGSSDHGYEFTAPLDGKGHLDPAGWSRNKAACTARRFWDKADDEAGTLIHRRDGKWAFSYRPGDEDDEPIFRFDTHRFVVGEYVSVTEHDGVEWPFKVVHSFLNSLTQINARPPAVCIINRRGREGEDAGCELLLVHRTHERRAVHGLGSRPSRREN